MNYKKLAGSLIIAAMLLVSCSKKITTGVEDVTYTGPKTVGFNNYGGYFEYSAVIENKLDTALFQLKLSNTTSTASSPIRVTLVRDNALVSEYNTNNGTSLVSIPIANIYLVDEVVTIPAGQRMVNFKLAFNPTRLGGGTALGIGIAKVEGDGATVNGEIEQNRVVINISALNQWDGIYSLKGYTLRAGDLAKTGLVSAYEIPLITTSVSDVVFGDYQLWADATPVAVGFPILSTSSSNSVTVSATPLATPLAVPVSNTLGYNSRYVPATRTFYISYTWNAGPTSRLATDTLTYLRPR